MSARRRLVTVAVAIEAAAVAGYGAFLAVEAIVAPATDRIAAVFLILVVLVIAGGLAAVARAVARGARGARAPVLVWQVLQASVAVPAVGTARWYLAVPLLVLCVAAGVGVLGPDAPPGETA